MRCTSRWLSGRTALEPLYPLVFFDAPRVKVRDGGTVRNKAVYLALGVRPDGSKEALGLWIEQAEDAKFWLRVMNELRTRGVNDILIAVVDGLNGFPEAIGASFPQTQVQTCIVHLLRHSLSFAAWKDRRELTAALRPMYTAVNAEAAREALEDFAAGPWGRNIRRSPPLATAVGAGDPVPCLSARGAADHLHHQRDREPQQQAAFRGA